MALPQGPCHLCGKQKVLTYEHVPASSSYNNEPVEMFGFEHWLKRAPSGELSGGELKDRGAGVHTLCADCNSLTGGQYVPELKEWTGRGMSIVVQAMKEGPPPGNAVECADKRVRPALFVKQLVAMLASVNQPTLLDDHPELRRFVLEREATGLPSRYQFYLGLTHPKSTVFRFAGLSPLVRDGLWCVTWVTDLVWAPFVYAMTIDEPAPLFAIGNIGAFADRKHNQVEDMILQLPLLVGEQPYQVSFRIRSNRLAIRHAFRRIRLRGSRSSLSLRPVSAVKAKSHTRSRSPNGRAKRSTTLCMGSCASCASRRVNVLTFSLDGTVHRYCWKFGPIKGWSG